MIFICLLKKGLNIVGGSLHVIALKELDYTLVAKRCEGGIDRKVSKHLGVMGLRKLINMALAIGTNNIAAIGTNNIAVILNQIGRAHV